MSNSLYLAVDAGGSFLKAAFYEPHSRTEPAFVNRETLFSVPVNSDADAGSIQKSYEELASRAREKASHLNGKIVSVIMCIPGPFNYEAGISDMEHKYASIRGIPIRPWFQHILGQIPILFLHDSTAFILGEITPEDIEQKRSICCVLIGTGLGFASLKKGKILLNAQQGPGISLYARPFKEGTAEDYVSKRAVEKEYLLLKNKTGINEYQPYLSVREIAEKARDKDPDAMQCFQDLGSNLGEIMAPVMEKEGFQKIILGGAISKSSDLFLPSLSRTIGSKCSFRPVILPSEDIDNGPLDGCIRYAQLKGSGVFETYF